jgi:hypothetical protein
MSVLYREVTNEKRKGYDIVDYDSSVCIENAKMFKDQLSIATVNGALGFFLNIGKEYIAITQSYLKKNKKSKITEIHSNNLAQSGVGMV